jgi:predicted NBD/HSP70 family sugar kinase
VLIDIGGTTTRVGLCTTQPSEILSLTRFSTIYSYAEFLDRIREYSSGLAQKAEAVCVAFGVGLSKGTVTGAGKMPDFVGRAIEADLSAAFRCPAFVAHDCICALLRILGGNRVEGCVGYVTISSGIGAAIAFSDINCTVLQRIRIGHHVIQMGGTLCKCGRKGCLSAFVDSKTLESALRRPLSEVVDEEFWRQYVDRMAVGLGNLAVTTGLDRLYLGGGIAANDIVRDRLPHRVQNEIGTGGGYGACKVEWITSYEEAPMQGAYYLAGDNELVIRG